LVGHDREVYDPEWSEGLTSAITVDREITRFDALGIPTIDVGSATMDIGAMSCSGMVLLIEGNESNSTLVKAALEPEGFQVEVEVATSAAEARHLLRVITPAVILMGIQLPGEDGSTRTELKAPPTSRIPIVDLSSPVDTRTFVAQVRRVLDNPQQFAEKVGAA
jgi:CheY-like chemotaxis protein